MGKSQRWVFQSLFLSVTLNVILLGVFFYFFIHDNPLHFSYHPKETLHTGKPPMPIGFLKRLPDVSYEHLLELLNDERKMETGFRVCEVALGALAQYHHFDVERALGRGKLSKHLWEDEESEFLIFPGLTRGDYETLLCFANTERWPLTLQGLFERIRIEGVEKCDPELIHFFCHTPEFVIFETLFARTYLPIQKRNVLNVALEGGWEIFLTFSQEEQRNIDFSNEMRQHILMGAIDAGSKTAAYLLLITDAQFALCQLEDSRLSRMLDLLTVKTAESCQFVQTVLASSRIETIRQKAMAKMCEYAETEPGRMAGHFYEKPGQKDLHPPFRQVPPAAPPPSVHIVKEGESLWLIARKYHISIDDLMAANQLSTSVIRPGKSLKIPHP
jgi:hypothetical protein